MFSIRSNKHDLDMTLIPLLALYITNDINNKQLIKNGVLYSNCDRIKFIILYRIVIPSVSNNKDIIVLIIKPIFLLNKLFIFSNKLRSCL
jgi:hypothetical protein